MERNTIENSGSFCYNSLNNKQDLSISNEALDVIRELGYILQDIHDRLVLEGYEIGENIITKKNIKNEKNDNI